MTKYTNHGKTSSAKRNCGQKPKLGERDWKGLCLKIIELLQPWWQLNSFILKTLFSQKQS